MRVVRLTAPGDLDNLKLIEEDHPKPRPHELLVRIRARYSLNFHDDLVVHGKIPSADGREFRYPMVPEKCLPSATMSR